MCGLFDQKSALFGPFAGYQKKVEDGVSPMSTGISSSYLLLLQAAYNVNTACANAVYLLVVSLFVVQKVFCFVVVSQTNLVRSFRRLTYGSVKAVT